jgi:mono/diheme cytochrome c family protein
VRRLLAALSVVVLVAVLALAAGCVDSSEEAAQTPASAPTVVNSAAQTDSAGKTVTAPAATAPAATAPAGGGTTPSAPAGDVAAGQQVFASTCTSCHLNNGMDAGGVGPQLAGAGLSAAVIDDTVTNGRPGTAMVGGLVSGADKENVEAYVLSLQ